MGKVRALKEEVFRKIAAGEVVERPLSVVKELVENAIDAGADDIKVDVVEGGKGLIRVTDNGEGFLPEDIEPAFKRHSTSKLIELDDFNRLLTLGFRGEALPSILEVARITVKTSCTADGKGILCRLEENSLVAREEIACQRGAAIEVRDLFYNFPVRRKFLKSDRAELSQIVSLLEQQALAHFAVAFSLVSGNRPVFTYNRAATLKERIYQVFGKDFLDNLQEVSFDYFQYRLTGFISRLNTGVSDKKYQFFFVNKRPVKERTLIAAFNTSFHDYLEKSKSPAGILLLDIPPAEIDVNIHPMKLEIKFENSAAIFQFIKRAIDSAFGRTFVPDGPAIDGGRRSGFTPISFPGSQPAVARPATWPTEGPAATVVGEKQTAFPQPRLFTDNFYSEDGFYLLGQYHNSYIIIEKEHSLLVIDQHNAQERIHFDRLKEQYQKSGIASITPLFPLVIELSPSEVSLLDAERLQMLEKIGFDLRPLSGNSYDVKTFPQVLPEQSIKETIIDILHLEGADSDFEDKILAQVACKSAVKVNTRLVPEEMKVIVKGLFQTGNPYFCPHQRPIIIDFSLEKIEKLLKRR